jgi:outer membrane protein OmpA-like peptidoglycan-associated protein
MILTSVGKKTEWFKASLDDIDEAYNAIINGISRKNNFQLRDEQKLAVDKAIKFYENNSVFLFNAIMRFGKTFSAFEVMRNLDAKKVLILTYKPSVKDEWKNELENHINFKDYVFIDALKLNLDDEREKLTLDKTVLFVFDKAIVQKASMGELESIINIMNTYPNLKVVLEGHTDAKGAESYNKELSKNRVNAVRDYLIMNGVDKKRIITTKYFGEEKPVDSNETADGRRNNRRVDVRFIK